MKTYNITNRISAQAKKAIQNMIDGHERYSKSYFWKSGGNSSSRRGAEKKFKSNYPEFELIKGDQKITVSPSYQESCKNVYYSLSISVNDQSKDIRTLKNIIK